MLEPGALSSQSNLTWLIWQWKIHLTLFYRWCSFFSHVWGFSVASLDSQVGTTCVHRQLTAGIFDSARRKFEGAASIAWHVNFVVVCQFQHAWPFKDAYSAGTCRNLWCSCHNIAWKCIRYEMHSVLSAIWRSIAASRSFCREAFCKVANGACFLYRRPGWELSSRRAEWLQDQRLDLGMASMYWLLGNSMAPFDEKTCNNCSQFLRFLKPHGFPVNIVPLIWRMDARVLPRLRSRTESPLLGLRRKLMQHCCRAATLHWCCTKTSIVLQPHPSAARWKKAGRTGTWKKSCASWWILVDSLSDPVIIPLYLYSVS